MIWGIIALYAKVTRRFCCPGGLSKEIASTIGVNQGCPLSPILFGLCIDEILEFIDKGWGRGGTLNNFVVALMLYANDIVLMANSQEGLQRHIEPLEDLGLTVNLGNTMVILFHTSLRVMQDTVITFRW